MKYLGVSVFPTPVGMVRVRNARFTGRHGFPHARGDGPRKEQGNEYHLSFSPRPWGWSGSDARACLVGDVFPTPVGMVRLSATNSPYRWRFPHARGDGPRVGYFRPRPV